MFNPIKGFILIKAWTIGWSPFIVLKLKNIIWRLVNVRNIGTGFFSIKLKTKVKRLMMVTMMEIDEDIFW